MKIEKGSIPLLLVVLCSLSLEAIGQTEVEGGNPSLPSPHKLILKLEKALEKTYQWQDCQLEVKDIVLDCICLQGTENRVAAKIYRVGNYVVEVEIRDVGGGTYFKDVWGDTKFKKNKSDVHQGLPIGYRKQYKDLVRRVVKPTPWYLKATGTAIVAGAIIYGSAVIMRGGNGP